MANFMPSCVRLIKLKPSFVRVSDFKSYGVHLANFMPHNCSFGNVDAILRAFHKVYCMFSSCNIFLRDLVYI
jgi:hypothetical protein